MTELSIMSSTKNQQVEDPSDDFPACNPDSRCPWLVFKHEMISCTFYNVVTGQCSVKEITQFKDTYICGSSYGWLAMIDTHNSDCFLFNPFSFEKFKLPNREPRTGWCMLSSPPTDQSCTVMFLDNKSSSISFCRVGEMEWNEVIYVDEELMYFTVVDEKFYILNYQKSLFVLDFFGGDGKNLRLKKIIEGGLNSSKSSLEPHLNRAILIESCGNIFAVIIANMGIWSSKIGAIEVFKMNFSKLEWVRVESLGDFSFFINRNGINSMSRCASEVGVKANSIYIISNCDRRLYRYDLEERRLNYFLPCPNMDREWEKIIDNVPVWLGS